MEKTNKLIFVYAFVVVVVVLLVYFIIITILITVNPDFSDAKEYTCITGVCSLVEIWNQQRLLSVVADVCL